MLASFPKMYKVKLRPATRVDGYGKTCSYLIASFSARTRPVHINQFAQDRNLNADDIFYEALRLIGLIDQAVFGTGSDNA